MGTGHCRPAVAHVLLWRRPARDGAAVVCADAFDSTDKPPSGLCSSLCSHNPACRVSGVFTDTDPFTGETITRTETNCTAWAGCGDW